MPTSPRFRRWRAKCSSDLPDPLMLIDDTGRVMFANRAMRGVIGVDAERKHVSALLRTPAVLEAIRKTAATGEPVVGRIHPAGAGAAQLSGHVARTGSSRPATILLLHDLTAMKRAEQMRADFVANASHELRTPLAALSGFIDTLKGHATRRPARRASSSSTS